MEVLAPTGSMLTPRTGKLNSVAVNSRSWQSAPLSGTPRVKGIAVGKNASRSLGVAAVLDMPREEKAKQKKVTGLRTGEKIDLQLQNGPYLSAEERIHEVVVKQAAEAFIARARGASVPEFNGVVDPELLDDAFLRCGHVCAEYAKTFYLGTQLMTEERRRAIWAIYVWCRRTDELVDGPNASHITPGALDRWEERLEEAFQCRPYDMFDAALSHTIVQYPLSIQPFRDMIDGMRMDLHKSRYQTFDELYVYCYNVAGTVGLMSVPVMGIDPKATVPTDSVFSSALALGIANQLTNILRDVGEDSLRGRVYLPQDELAAFGLSDADIFEGKVTQKWRDFMRFQIDRARRYFKLAEDGVYQLDAQSRWPVWASLSLYSRILEAIEDNDYDNFSKRAYVGKWKKMSGLPAAYFQALKGPPPQRTPASS